MTVSTFFSTTADGIVRSGPGTTYSTVRAGTSLFLDNAGTTFPVGQTFITPNYRCWEGFLDFDTSSIADTDTIDSVVLSLWGESNESDTDFTVEARLQDWGATLETTDWIAGADLGTPPLMATYATTGFTTGVYNAFTSDAAFVGNINKAGVTRLVLCSERHRNNTTPTGLERVIFQSNEGANDPKLVVTHTAPGGAPTVSRRTVIGVGL
jgi:hypothetical protein